MANYSRKTDIRSLLDIPEWEGIQDELARLTGTAIITIDYKGTPISKHSARTEFCTVIRENPISRKRCIRCDSLAGLEAVRLGRPYIYLCHCGIVDVAVPVVVGDRYLGAVMFGQVRIPNDDTDAKVERLVNEISSLRRGDGSEDLLAMYYRLPEMEYKRIVEIAGLIDSIIKYIITRTLKSQNDLLQQTYQMQRQLPPVINVEGNRADAWMESLSDMPEPPDSKALVQGGSGGGHARTQVQLADIAMTSPVYPAVAYIGEHPTEMIGMKDMAALCHLSASYFSRLFGREVGENFNSYVNRVKIEWAMEALLHTQDTVALIADELGFQDVSYFVKVFKRYQGITPMAFRRASKKS